MVGWLLGALTALVILAVASVLAPPAGPRGPGSASSVAGGLDVAPLATATPVIAPAAPATEPTTQIEAIAPAAAPSPAAQPTAPAAVAAAPTTQTEAAAPAAPSPPAAITPAVSPDQAAPAPSPPAPAPADASAAPAPASTVASQAPPASAAPQAAAPVTAPAETDPAPALTAPDAPAPQVAASDAAPAAEPAPAHDVLLEPAAVPAAAPDAGASPGMTGAAPAAPAVTAEAPVSPAAPDKPVVLNLGTETPPQPGQTPTVEDDKPSTLLGVGSLTNRAPDVKTGALPQIGKGDAAAPAALPQIGAPAEPKVGTGLPQIGTAPPAAAAPANVTGPIADFARPFTPVDPAKPAFVILLRDIGAAGMDRASLLKLPFPVSVVLDPLSPDAPGVMQAWRQAGQEVVLSMTGLPEGAVASDVAQTFQALTTSLPETVAVIDTTGATFQNNRPLATLVVPEVKDSGRGLVTFDEGLDAADQIARRDGVPATRIFRRLDAQGEAKDVIRRYLDRAAFKAAQDGFVVVMGDTRPETIAAILEWTVEGRASNVNLAPLTAVLGR
jgi:hypothetical protein